MKTFEQSNSRQAQRTWKVATHMDEHKAEELKGRLKEAAGVVTGDDKMRREGKVDQYSAKTKAAIDSAADKLKGVVDR